VDPGERGANRLCGLLRSLLGCEQCHIIVDLSAQAGENRE
jgi:hypothetical protein